MNSYDIKGKIESGRGKLEIVNAGRDYMCYIDDGSTVTNAIRICLIGEIRSGSGGDYDISGMGGNDIECEYVKKELEKIYGKNIEFSNLSGSSYKIRKGYSSIEFWDIDTHVAALVGSGYVEQCDLERKVREEQERITKEESRLRKEEAERIETQTINGLLNQMFRTYEKGNYQQYIDTVFLLLEEFKHKVNLNYYNLYTRLGVAHTHTKEPEKAIGYFKKALRLKKDVNLFYSISLLYEQLDIGKAIKWYKKIIKFGENTKYFKKSFYKVALLYVKQFNEELEKPNKAIHYFDKLAKWLGINRVSAPIRELKLHLEEKVGKERRQILYSLARDYSKRGNFREGVKYYKLLIQDLRM